MMKNRTSSRTGLFLMELIIAVLFFALASAVCIQLFVKSHVISQSSVDLNHSILWSQNVAETFHACNGNVQKMHQLFEHSAYEKGSDETEYLTLYFDEDFSPLTQEAVTNQTAYCYSISASIQSTKSGLINCHIEAIKTSQKSNIFELQTTLFPNKEITHAQ